MPAKSTSTAQLLKHVASGIFAIIFLVINFSLQAQIGPKYVSARPGMDTRDSLWGSWNVLFRAGTGAATIKASITSVEDDIRTKFNSLFGPSFHLFFQVFYCPCDSLLYNIGAKVLSGVGQSVTSPPPPPGLGGHGDDIESVSVNNTMDNIDYTESPVDTSSSNKLVLTNPSGSIKVGKKVVAFIDTGLDPRFITPRIPGLIWLQGTGTPGTRVYNFINGSTNYFDDNKGKHGTAVIAVALLALMRNQSTAATLSDPLHPVNPAKVVLPRIMVLKALDANKQGTTFTVSCAISYAVKHKADVINASLGYYGDADPVLRHYVELCGQQKPAITFFAAAGNVLGTHNRDRLCDDAVAGNELVSGRMFYPACFSENFSHVITVTGLNNGGEGCSYQNYSSRFVSLGVKNHPDCCFFRLKWKTCEGTSFETPAACGTALSLLLHGATIDDFIRLLQSASPSHVTKDGKYMGYKDR